jgi:hypothetical protein
MMNHFQIISKNLIMRVSFISILILNISFQTFGQCDSISINKILLKEGFGMLQDTFNVTAESFTFKEILTEINQDSLSFFEVEYSARSHAPKILVAVDPLKCINVKLINPAHFNEYFKQIPKSKLGLYSKSLMYILLSQSGDSLIPIAGQPDSSRYSTAGLKTLSPYLYHIYFTNSKNTLKTKWHKAYYSKNILETMIFCVDKYERSKENKIRITQLNFRFNDSGELIEIITDEFFINQF